MLLLLPYSVLALAAVAEPASLPMSDGVALAGEWLFPDGDAQVPAVLLVGGTMSHTRDGAMEGHGPAGAQRDALRRLADRLAAAGYASLRWDQRGHGGSPLGAGASYARQAEDLATLLDLARRHPRVTGVLAAGESAGGYVCCVAARSGHRADGYLLLGALASDYETLFAYNYGRLFDWAQQSEANARFARETAADALALGSAYREMFAAARRGDDRYVIRFEGRELPRDLGGIKECLADPPLELFQHLQRPTLAIQGADDMNVPPGDAARIGEAMRAAGHAEVAVVEVPQADHSFQFAAATEDRRLYERHSFASFYKLYHPAFYDGLTHWLAEHFPSPQPAVEPQAVPRPGITHWAQIQVIEDILDPVGSPGVETLEGRIGPLLKAVGCQAHYIDMPAGMYIHEHSHSTESIIYVARGQFVLCSEGRRQAMREGSLFWFGPGAPTGWEVPFDEPCYILIFKGDRSDWSDERFWQYLVGMAEGLRQEHADGEEFTFAELPPDHPARVYAREINPAWEARLPK